MAELKWYGKEVEALVKKAALSGLHDGAEAILTEAIDETPLLSGTLHRSGTVTDVPTEDAVYISFNTPYAVRQHEDLTLRHKDGKAKYLEDPYKRNKEKVINLVGSRVAYVLKGK